MLTDDFEPLFRTSVGFDALARLLQSTLDSAPSADTYPPYNIESQGENVYRITLSVAGFGAEELAIETREDWLFIRGQKAAQERAPAYLYRGLAIDDFERRFQLADHIKVTGAHLAEGLLTIDLAREVPEALRPRRIEIAAGKPGFVQKAKKLFSGEPAA